MFIKIFDEIDDDAVVIAMVYRFIIGKQSTLLSPQAENCWINSFLDPSQSIFLGSHSFSVLGKNTELRIISGREVK